MSDLELPLFPLATVLFPGGKLDMRIFERRYLDMVRDCTRSGTGFGICLIVRGREAGEPAIPAAYGTVAKIEDFATLPDGLLGITTRGGARFRVESSRVRDSGLIIGKVTLKDPDPVVAVPAETPIHWRDASVLAALAPQATRVRLSGGGTQTVNVTVRRR